MQGHKFKVGGLHCEGCASSVRHVLQAQKGVVTAEVDLASETATVTALTDFDSAAAVKAVVQAGFSLQPV